MMKKMKKKRSKVRCGGRARKMVFQALESRYLLAGEVGDVSGMSADKFDLAEDHYAVSGNGYKQFDVVLTAESNDARTVASEELQGESGRGDGELTRAILHGFIFGINYAVSADVFSGAVGMTSSSVVDGTTTNANGTQLYSSAQVAVSAKWAYVRLQYEVQTSITERTGWEGQAGGYFDEDAKSYQTSQVGTVFAFGSNIQIGLGGGIRSNMVTLNAGGGNVNLPDVPYADKTEAYTYISITAPTFSATVDGVSSVCSNSVIYPGNDDVSMFDKEGFGYFSVNASGRDGMKVRAEASSTRMLAYQNQGLDLFRENSLQAGADFVPAGSRVLRTGSLGAITVAGDEYDFDTADLRGRTPSPQEVDKLMELNYIGGDREPIWQAVYPYGALLDSIWS